MVITADLIGLPSAVLRCSHGTNAQAPSGAPVSSECSGYMLVKLIAGARSGWSREESKKDVVLCLRTKMNPPSKPFLSDVLKYNMT